jgi:hypothetical protein
MKNKISLGAGLGLLGLLVANFSIAATEPLFHNIDEVIAKFNVILNWLFTGASILTVTFVLIAAYKILTSGGGKGVEEGRKTLIYAAIGFAVALLAKSVPAVITAFFS